MLAVIALLLFFPTYEFDLSTIFERDESILYRISAGMMDIGEAEFFVSNDRQGRIILRTKTAIYGNNVSAQRVTETSNLLSPQGDFIKSIVSMGYKIWPEGKSIITNKILVSYEIDHIMCEVNQGGKAGFIKYLNT